MLFCSKSPKKDFFKKKEPKKSSPRKSGDSTKFKSAEFVETSDESSSEEDKVLRRIIFPVHAQFIWFTAEIP